MIAERQQATYDSIAQAPILIIGEGCHGLLLAKELLVLGLSVIVVEKEEHIGLYWGGPSASKPALDILADEISSHPRAEIFSKTRIRNLLGDVGRFEAELVQDGQEINRTVAAVAVVPEPRTRPLFAPWNLQPSAKVISISDLERGSLTEKESTSMKNVLFLDHPGGEGSPWQSRRLLQGALKMQGQSGIQCYLVTPQVKIAEEGSERLYREAREAGVIFVRTDEARAKEGPHGVTLFYQDSLLDRRFYLTPDLVVVGEEEMSPENLGSWAEALGVVLDQWGWMQEDNVLRSPFATNRLGVWVVGAGAGPISPQSLGTMILAAAEEIFSQSKGEPSFPLVPAVELSRARCARCLACIRLCPHGAISWENKPVFSPRACQACGICASECPREVLKLIGCADQEIREQLSSPWKPDGTPRVVLLCCEKSGRAALDSLSEERRRALNVKVVSFSCAGRIKMTFMINSFYLGNGSEGVMILGCHIDNCKSGTGTIYARNRVAAVKEAMAEMGLEPERVEFLSVASNMGAWLYREVLQFKNRLSQLEPFPKTVGYS
jgi:coenzyme F420-reducing hydrogenase delta subunit/Pyruvate/2-oxoacid:ferredoxin oxidoreductase delta subunit